MLQIKVDTDKHIIYFILYTDLLVDIDVVADMD